MEKSIAKDLLSIGAVFLRPEQPFTWASGIKSPIYCDNRLTLTAPAVRDNVEKGLAELVKKHYPEAKIIEINREHGEWEVKISGGLELTFNKAYKLIDIDD